MDANNFDQFSRAFGRGISRRGLLALLMGAVGLRARDTGAAQLTPPACGQAGAVCTMLAGCCEGFTCVTSTINVNYGVCAAGGEGGTVAGTTSLVSPFADGAEQQVASAATDTSTTSTTDPQAERDAEIAQRKARKDAHRSKIQSRKNQQQLRRDDRKGDQQLDRAPGLNFGLNRSEGPGDAEEVLVTNRSNGSVFISRIQRLNDERTYSSLSKTLGSGQTFFFLSGLPNNTEIDANDEYLWLADTRVCDDMTDGFVITASKSSSSRNHDFTVLCDGTLPESRGRRKRNKNQNRKRAKKRQQHKSKTKQGKKGRRG